jgi:CBS domain-containing protein
VSNESTNIVVCPSCGAENIEGTDTCQNCQADLRSIDVPEIYQVASESDLLLPVSSLRLRKPETVRPTVSVSEAVAVMQRDPTGAVIIVDDGKIIGIFTERDLLKKCAGDPDALAAPVNEYMTHDPVVLRVTDSMAIALNKMGVGGFRHIPIIQEGGGLLGIVTARDVWQWLMGRYFD